MGSEFQSKIQNPKSKIPSWIPNSAKVSNGIRRSPSILSIFRKIIMDFDYRLLIVLAPLALAGGWAIFNVFPVALKQVQELLRDKD
jgi:photosystem II PsbY protein